MGIQDLGNLEAERLLVFGGPYGNFEATTALFHAAEKQGISPKHMFCTGDIAAYCADPLETSYLLRDKHINVIQGNCEQALAEAADHCGCGFAEGTTCERLAKSWFDYCQTHIDGAIRAWFASLPHHIRFTFGGGSFLMVHGGVEDVSAFVFSSDPEEKFLSLLKAAHADGVIAGHCGLPFTRIINTACWHNAGVIGMPANDGTSRGWYSVISQKHGSIYFEHKAFDYDACSAYQKMLAADLPAGYAEALTTGRWPSLDILPKYERAQTGKRLEQQNITWKPV